jgi:hypothetical protein
MRRGGGATDLRMRTYTLRYDHAHDREDCGTGERLMKTKLIELNKATNLRAHGF